MINALQNALSGILSAQKKLNVSAQNIANAPSKGTTESRPGPKVYEAQTSVQAPLIDSQGQVIGTQTKSVNQNPATRLVYDPDSLLADNQGFVREPDVNFVQEAVNVSLASLSFKANAQILNAVQDLSLATSRAFQSDFF